MASKWKIMAFNSRFNLQHYISKIRFYKSYCYIGLSTLFIYDYLLLFLFTSMKSNSRFHLNCGCYCGERAKYKLCIFTHFDKFGLIVPKSINIRDQDTLLQLLIEKQCILPSNKGRIASNISKDIRTPFLPRGESFKFVKFRIATTKSDA